MIVEQDRTPWAVALWVVPIQTFVSIDCPDADSSSTRNGTLGCIPIHPEGNVLGNKQLVQHAELTNSDSEQRVIMLSQSLEVDI
jgi:hypothetical protein